MGHMPVRFGLFGLVVVAVLAVSTMSSAQQEYLCADPRGFCSALIRPECLSRIEAGTLDDENDAECGGALIAWRACLGDAVDCPGVVDPATPSAPGEARPPCAAGECPEQPDVPLIRQAPDGPALPEDERRQSLENG